MLPSNRWRWLVLKYTSFFHGRAATTKTFRTPFAWGNFTGRFAWPNWSMNGVSNRENAAISNAILRTIVKFIAKLFLFRNLGVGNANTHSNTSNYIFYVTLWAISRAATNWHQQFGFHLPKVSIKCCLLFRHLRNLKLGPSLQKV